MTMDRSLKQHGRLKGARSVHTRAERIAKMTEEGKFDPESDNPFGLPKLRVHVSRAGSKSKKEQPAEETAEDKTAESGDDKKSSDEAPF